MATSYEAIYQRFLKKIQDKDLPNFEPSEQYEMLKGWLDTALAIMEFDGLEITNNLSDKDDLFEEFTADLTNIEMEGIAMYMVVAWYEDKIHSLEHTLMMVGSSSEKWTSQKDHLNMMMNVQRSKRIEARKYFRNFGYRNNNYLGE